MTSARALLIAAAAMLAAGCGALGIPEPGAPPLLMDLASSDCPDHASSTAVASAPSAQVFAALMP